MKPLNFVYRYHWLCDALSVTYFIRDRKVSWHGYLKINIHASRKDIIFELYSPLKISLTSVHHLRTS